MTNFPSDTVDPPTIVLDRHARKALLGELPPAMRALHVEVLRRTLAEGVPVSPAAVTVVLSAHDDAADRPLCFTAGHVNELLWYGIAEFCEDYGIEMPDGCREALYAILAFGTALDLLDPESDDEAALFSAFRELVTS